MVDTLTALYRRNEVFWIGLSAIILGIMMPATLSIGRIDLSQLFFVTGGGLLITSVFVGFYRVLTPT